MKNSNLLNVWLNKNVFNEQELKTLQTLNKEEQLARFSSPLIFGRVGLRLPIGIGSNHFNRHTIKQLILAIINIFQKVEKNFQTLKIAVFHDARKHSKEFTLLTAEILSSYGMKVKLFPKNDVAPSPFLVYLLTQKQIDYGLMITASHQTKEINGCKLFVRNQGIADSKFVDLINNEIQKNHLHFLTQTFQSQPKLISEIDLRSKQTYFQKIQKYLNLPHDPQIKILYSSLHGCGAGWTDQLLKETGFAVSLVEKQCFLDPNFTTVDDPNPENDKSFALALKQAQIEKPNLIILNDSDADRMRVACLTSEGYKLFSGNEIATIFIYFLLDELKRKGKIYMTEVSTNLIYKISENYGCQTKSTATGFANLAKKYSQDSKKDFLFAFEESIGFLLNRNINNDKDGIQAAFFIVQIANFLQFQNKTLWDYLVNIYKKYGYFSYGNSKIKLNNAQEVKEIFEKIHNLKRIEKIIVTKNIKHFEKDKNDVQQVFFENGCWVGCRESVTEPIFKFYFVCRNISADVSKTNLINLKKSWMHEFKIQ